MLNPPLSLVSDDLLTYIVEHVAKLPFDDENLRNLSLTDRAFTQSCQKFIFRTLKLGNNGSGGTRSRISKKLKTTTKTLNKKPIFANQVRTVKLTISHQENAWLFDHPTPKNNLTLISILQLLAKSPVPPHELRFGGQPFRGIIIEDPILVVGQLVQSFFSQTLTILHLTSIRNLPFPLFLICPKLREVLLDCVGVAETSYDKYPENQCSARELPALELLDYRDSHGIVQQMTTPPPRFNSSSGVLWSNLRILTLSPHEKEEMACLQFILDAACNTLEELYLTGIKVGPPQQLPLAGLVNLGVLSRLHVFSIFAIINCERPKFEVLRDLNIVLDRIPESNKITNLSFYFNTIGRPPFRVCRSQDWAGMFHEVKRISAGKPLELELQLTVSTGDLDHDYLGQEELYQHILKRTTSFSKYPKICTHFWNPTLGAHGIGPFPYGQVRSRCRQ